MIKCTGSNNISATVIADSISPQRIRMTTMELEYPRFIHAELMTHRMLSKNAASSRAIPILAMHEAIKDKTAMPVHWGKNQPGMSAKEEVDDLTKRGAVGVWIAARDSMLSHSTILSSSGLHKQIANRITEPFQMMKTVISGTEWANLLWLRHHPDAQPEFFELAKQISEAFEKSVPMFIKAGEYHVPYVQRVCREEDGKMLYMDSNETEMSAEDALKVSASCCAQVSYRKNDDSLEKAKNIFARLIESEPLHASPVEHQATPMVITDTGPYIEGMSPTRWEEGVTHMDKNRAYWSGNLRGWIQHRKLLANEAVW